MRSLHDPRDTAPTDPELDSTDGGWDPYVTALLMGEALAADAAQDDEDDGAPVMSFSRMPGAGR
jgi:hypothetical protein